MAKTSRVQRALAQLRKSGYVPVVVEHWNSFAGIRQDLLGIIDILAFDPCLQIVVGVQVCGISDNAAHWRKLTEDCKAESSLWLNCAGPLEIHAWRKIKRGNRRVWAPKITPVRLD